MELLWIITVTLLALIAAYFVGGYLDRRTRALQEQEEEQQRERYLAELADFSLGFARRLTEQGYAGEKGAQGIACLLCRYLSDYSGQGCSEQEWLWLQKHLREEGEAGASGTAS